MTAPTLRQMADILLKDGADPTSVESLAGMVLDRLRYGPDGIPTVLRVDGTPAVDPNGIPVSPAEMMEALRRDLPMYWRQAPMQPEPQKDETVTEKVMRLAKERREASKPVPAGEANPWRKETLNITQQVLMTKRDPARAARLKAEAGR